MAWYKQKTDGVNQIYTRQRKINSRQSTIINYYRQVSGNQMLPKDKQYWTMCNRCSVNSELKENSELDQILKQKLITPNQFYGVDIDYNCIKENRKLDIEVGAWINDDFYSAMCEADYNNNFNPGIIYLDTTHMTKTNLEEISRILWLLKEREYSKVLLVCNNILRFLTRGTKQEEFDYNINLIEALNETDIGKMILSDPKLKVSPTCYVYSGCGGKKDVQSTKMGTVCFWRD